MINAITFYYRTNSGNRFIKFFFYYLVLLIILLILYYSSFEHSYYKTNKYFGKCFIKEIYGNCPYIRIKGVFNDVYGFESIVNCKKSSTLSMTLTKFNEPMVYQIPYVWYSKIVNCYNFKGLIIFERLSQKIYNHYIGLWIYTIGSIQLYIIIQIIFGVVIVNEIVNY